MTMKHKVSELEGALLDAAVAKADGWGFRLVDSDPPFIWLTDGPDDDPEFQFSPSTNWTQAGPIIERERIGFDWDGARWTAWYQSKLPDNTQDGPTALIAAMRAYVASKFGEEVEL